MRRLQKLSPQDENDGEEEESPEDIEVKLPADNGQGPNGLAVLPQVIQSLVDRRRTVKKLLEQEVGLYIYSGFKVFVLTPFVLYYRRTRPKRVNWT